MQGGLARLLHLSTTAGVLQVEVYSVNRTVSASGNECGISGALDIRWRPYVHGHSIKTIYDSKLLPFCHCPLCASPWYEVRIWHKSNELLCLQVCTTCATLVVGLSSEIRARYHSCSQAGLPY